VPIVTYSKIKELRARLRAGGHERSRSWSGETIGRARTPLFFHNLRTCERSPASFRHPTTRKRDRTGGLGNRPDHWIARPVPGKSGLDEWRVIVTGGEGAEASVPRRPPGYAASAAGAKNSSAVAGFSLFGSISDPARHGVRCMPIPPRYPRNAG